MTRTESSRTTALAVALLLAAACTPAADATSPVATEDRDVPAAPARTSAPAASPSVSDEEPAEAEAMPRSPTTSEPVPVAATPSPTPAEPTEDPVERGPQGDIVIDVVLEPRCAQVGDTMVVQVDTRPNVGLGIIAQYADGHPHGTMTVGETDEHGGFTYEWTITPEMPAGHAELLLGASDGDESGSRVEPFAVRDATGACDV